MVRAVSRPRRVALTMLQSQALAACVVLALLACSGCQASTTNVSVTKDDRALFPIAAPFEFGPTGRIDMTLKHLQPWHRTGLDVPDPDESRMGFFLTTSETQAHDLARVSPPHPVGTLDHLPRVSLEGRLDRPPRLGLVASYEREHSSLPGVLTTLASLHGVWA